MYGDVILTRDVTEHGLRAGDVGTVVERHTVANVSEEAYSVEFFDMTGNTVGVVILPARALARADASRPPGSARAERLTPTGLMPRAEVPQPAAATRPAGSNWRKLGSPLSGRLETVTTVSSYLSCTLRVWLVSSVVKAERPTCWASVRSLE